MIDSPIRGDAVAYFGYTSNLAERCVFSSARPGSGEPRLPDSYRDPGYPILIVTLMRLLGGEARYPVLLQLQAVLGAATVALALVLARRCMTAPWLAAAAILMVLWPHCIAITSYFLNETLVGFLSVLWLWLLATVGRDWRGALAALVGGRAGLVNAVLLPAAAVIAILLWITSKAARGAAAALRLRGVWAAIPRALPRRWTRGRLRADRCRASAGPPWSRPEEAVRCSKTASPACWSWPLPIPGGPATPSPASCMSWRAG